VVAVGGDLEPGTVLQAYRRGMFPMKLADGRLGWWSPLRRGVIPVDSLVISRSLRRSTRRYTVTFDVDFESVIEGCADPARPHGWIDSEMRDAYTRLHRLGWVHSVETWSDDGTLVGGLYGVAIGRLFAGESMFHRAVDASKVALVALVELMSAHPDALLDVQWVTPHLGSLGAVEVGRDEYIRMLSRALEV